MDKPSHFSLVVTGSIAVHGLLLLGLQGHAKAVVPPAEKVRITVISTPPKTEPVREAAGSEPTAPELPSPTAPAPRPLKTAKKQPQKPDPHPVPRTDAAPSPAAAEPADFTGVTLTSEGHGPGWASLTGNGQAGSGVLGAPRAGSAGGTGSGAGTGVSAGTGAGPRVVGLGSLSRPPKAPDLDRALLDNYPKAARAQGISGQALVRARILADGSVGALRVLSASTVEFGRACEHTLQGSRWSPPLDKQGNPVATELSYACNFDVDR